MDGTQCEYWCNRLCDVGLDSKQKANTAIEIRDALDDVLVSQRRFSEPLKPLLEAVMMLLEKEQPVFSSLAATHRLRITLLEVLKKVSLYSEFEAWVDRTFKLLLLIIVNDNEEMVVLALKLIVHLFKDFNVASKAHVNDFLSLVIDAYNSMPSVVAEAFPSRSGPNTPSSHPASGPLSASPTEIGLESTGSKHIPKSSLSFKMLNECPVIVFLLFQTYKELIPKWLPILASLAVQFISLRPTPQAEAHRLAASQNEVFTGVVPSLRRNSQYNDLMSAQVKSFSFLAYLIRGFGSSLKQFESSIALCTMQLFTDCPSELYHTRKELLVATRHILSTDYLRSFVPYIDQLLDIKILVGQGVSVQHSLKPMAFSTLADLLHHVRMDLTPNQVYKAINIYFSVIMEANYTSAIQAMATKLILNMIETIVAFNDLSVRRSLLFVILRNLLKKLQILNADLEQLENDMNKTVSTDDVNDKAHDLPMFRNPSALPEVSVPEKLKDRLFLFKNIVLGLKTVFYGLKQCNLPAPPGTIFTQQEWSSKLHFGSRFELEIISDLLIECLKGFRYYQVDESNDLYKNEKSVHPFQEPISTAQTTKLVEQKELLEVLATLYIRIDPSSFVEILETTFPKIFSCLIGNLALLHLIQSWMTAELASVNCTNIVLSFLCKNISKIGTDQSTEISVLLRLFKFAFMTVNIYPEKNEEVLRPHISFIISSCLELSASASHPLNYAYLLKALFRNISGGKFDSLYKEILPLLQLMLESFNRLMYTATLTSHKELYAELCLTLPIRLSVLLPHMNYLMKPLIVAFKGSPEIASQGLRIFELCLDNLTQEFFDALLEPIMSDLLSSLWNHLRLTQSNMQLHQSAVRILGKMGGRNRQVSFGTFGFQNIEGPNGVSSLKISFLNSNKSMDFRHSQYLFTASSTLNDQKSSQIEKSDAFRFLKTSLLALFESSVDPNNIWDKVHKISCKLAEFPSEQIDKITAYDLGPLKDEKFYQQNSVVSSVFKSLVEAQAFIEFKDEARFVLNHSAEWIVISEILRFHEHLIFEDQQEIFEKEVNTSYLDITSFIDGILLSLCSENVTTRENSLALIYHYLNTHKVLMDCESNIWKLPSFQQLFKTLCQYCYMELWYQKNAGFLGLRALFSSTLDKRYWLEYKLTEILRALFFILKDTPSDFGVLRLAEVQQFVIDVVRQYCTDNVAHSEDKIKHISSIFMPFFLELHHPNDQIRHTVKQLIETISTDCNISIEDLLSPAKEALLGPIFGKPLRALPFTIQIGHIDAINYCLQQAPSFLGLSDELIRLFRETIALADAEDDALVTMLKTSQSKDTSSLRKLRATCLRLLFSSLITLKFDHPQHFQTRTKIIAIFFKALYSSQEEIYSVAISALKYVLSQNQKLPKELLQSGLRPILMNLSDHNKLSVNCLEGLSRLLRLLTNYFKVEIGRKLLQHFSALSDTKDMERLSTFSLDSNQRMDVIVSLVSVFKDLPPLSVQFLGDLITSVGNVEKVIRRFLSSPLRRPLNNFLNFHAKDSWIYVINNISNPDIVAWHLQALKDPACNQLRELSVTFWDKIVELVSQTLSRDNLTPIFAVSVMKEMSPNIGSIPNAGVVSAKLIVLSKSIYEMLNNFNGWTYLCLTSCLDSITELLLSLLNLIEKKLEFALEVFRFKAEDINKFLPTYIDTLCQSLLDGNASSKKNVFLVCSSILADKSVKPSFKSFLLEKIMIPLTFSAVQENNFIDKEVIHAVYNNIWRLSVRETSDNYTVSDPLRMGILCLSTGLCKYHSNMLNDYRKSIIMSAWNYFKLDDPMVKQAAYATVSCFIAAYDTPAKIVTPVYISLLKAYQPEVRSFLDFSLDCLLPVLVTRLSSPADASFPLWAKLPRLVLSEDMQNISQTLNVYQIICKAPDLFFKNSKHFIVPIINALPKLVPLSGHSHEPRSLAIDMVNALYMWQKKLLDFDTPDMSSDTLFPTPVIESVLTFLIKFLSFFPEQVESASLSKRTLQIFSQFLKIPRWAEYNLGWDFFEKLLAKTDSDEKTATVISNSWQVLGVYLEHKDLSFIQKEHTNIIKLIDKSLRSGKLEIAYSLKKVITILLESRPTVVEDEDEVSEVDEFKQSLTSMVHDNLSNGSSVEATVCYLQIIKENHPESLDALLTPLNKVFQKVAKDHIVACLQNSYQSTVKMNVPLIKDSANLLVALIDIIKIRMAALGDQRRWFLSVIVQLIEKSASYHLCYHILNVIKEWVVIRRDSFLTVKEKTALILKMKTFEGRFNNELHKQANNLTSSIYRGSTFVQTELTARLKQAFLLATACRDPETRLDFMTILDSSMSRNAYSRLKYIFEASSWDSIPNFYWIKQANYVLLGAINTDNRIVLSESSLKFLSVTDVARGISSTQLEPNEKSQSEMSQNKLEFFRELNMFFEQVKELKVSELLIPLMHLQLLSDEEACKLWKEVFPLAWSTLDGYDRDDLLKSLIYLLTREFHIKQVNNRPNVIGTLVSSFCDCSPKVELPPHLVKYLGKLYGIYHDAIIFLEGQLENSVDLYQSTKVQESRNDAISELYASLGEEDMFYGHCRRTSKYLQTQVALSYEQLGMWGRAQQLYEQAQTKARSEAFPFSESEYNLWEDHWVLCAQKLQQWDVLTELAKHEGSSELLLECAWRISDWSSNRESLEVAIKSLSDIPTPRKLTFQSFMTLQKSLNQPTSVKEFHQTLAEAIHLALLKWHQLPERINQSHFPLLHLFQQFVELQEASNIYSYLSSINSQNLPTNVQCIKSALQVWQERLPNVWDDIGLWRDLLSWRQIIFSMINRIYLPLIPKLQSTGNDPSTSSNTSFFFRGYHETAWLINRFAHVARKHKLPSVCLNQLTKIYSLPNIEIQEAFYKLREQVLCYLQNPKELKTGLDIVSNTNLMYFNPRQKSEFFTLKGKFLEKLGKDDEANQTYAAAVQVDLGLSKAWAEWAHYNDINFRKSPENINFASNAVSCYLQAAGNYETYHARKMLARVLWLLSLDDAENTITKTYESYKGDIPGWHWLTFIPQLLNNLAKNDKRVAPQVLRKIAKSYPQALFFLLRTAKEELFQLKRAETTSQEQQTVESETSDNFSAKHSWDYADEIMSILKTAYPLMALTMETLVDQIQSRFKGKNDEDAFRLIVALLNDAVQHSIRCGILTEETRRPSSTEANLSLFVDNILPTPYKAKFKREFIETPMGLREYIRQLRKWRSYFECLLGKTPKKQYLEHYSSFLCEFHHQKFDEIEVFGQYLLHKDNNNNFSCIERFLPEVEFVVGHGNCYRKITVRDNGGELHSFVIQYPSARNCRREERIMQFTRYLNDALQANTETRRRCLNFYVPAAIPLSSHIRLLQDQPSSVSLQKIYEEYCDLRKFSKDEPANIFTDELSKWMQNAASRFTPESSESEKLATRKELFTKRIAIFEEIQKLYVPSTMLKDYFSNAFMNFSDFWLFRKSFSYQYACFSFLTYILSINNRIPSKVYFSKSSGSVWTSEALPAMISSSPVYHNGEVVPFRFTPNITEFIGKTCRDGLLGPSIMAIARALSKPDFDLNMILGTFVADDLQWWLNQHNKHQSSDFDFREKVNSNTDLIVRRVASLSQVAFGNLPVNQTAIDYLTQASSAKVLAQMDVLWAPWI
ncbi:SAGA complex phosphatidylinositol kinase-like protein Tra1 [Schizosaccharomyces cryophilus OY26]|uniref:SAGA complex phosphatidylinositol kinase-like protein Tra1 n=1 Tax=Schizosaccharomyces cryophilus (strain OY26 / ATCC MYA-4695 / CBS 11777 / NBRC 106824 / NRRL Y48691) TaxID=653667 RepID=S9XAP6_SCHCR|nr:SAGA complex phosphatidylinositol kinase-like protein Tra1 [Schizosaccharomyces cryophilus OY26]EPY54227.1 SAGA complex phosphatidylinositol kinase-like protein Tra1 [Schizosaccharomyces cryophilus OY26]